jgi:hypothetical protein
MVNSAHGSGFLIVSAKPEAGKSGQIHRPKVKYCSLVAGTYIVLPVRLNNGIIDWMAGCAVVAIRRVIGFFMEEVSG